MKRFGLLIMCFVAVVATSCNMLSSAAGSNTVANASGQACGAAVQGLYSAYSNTGKIDLTNATNLNNALALATCYTNLRQNKDDQSYRKAFTTGLIASSAGLITSSNASAFIDKLLASAGLANINSQNIAQTATTAATIISLFNTLKQ